jgi:hypothetical protein
MLTLLQYYCVLNALGSLCCNIASTTYAVHTMLARYIVCSDPLDSLYCKTTAFFITSYLYDYMLTDSTWR